MSPRSSTVGPGLATGRAGRRSRSSSRAAVRSSGSPSSDSSTMSRVTGRSLPISGQLVQRRRSATVSSCRSRASSRSVERHERSGGGRHRRHGRRHVAGAGRSPPCRGGRPGRASRPRSEFRCRRSPSERVSRPAPSGRQEDDACPQWIIGADVDQLHQLGDQLQPRAGVIIEASIIDASTSALASTTWHGPGARPRSTGEWHPARSGPALAQVDEALRRRRADECSTTGDGTARRR